MGQAVTGMARRSDWPERLGATIEDWRRRPFQWGQHDCCLFALRCIDAMTDAGLLGRFAGKYDSERSAMRILAPHGGLEGLARGIAAEFACQQVGALLAQRGDIVMAGVGLGGAPALGVVALDGCNGLFIGAEGLQAVPLRSCRQAWRVG